ncbi:hypothetical protein Tco_0378633 [Tanacetum coccineum]
MALLSQSFRATLPQTNNQLQASSNTQNQATIQDGRVLIQMFKGDKNQIKENRSSVITVMGLDIMEKELYSAEASTEFLLFQGQDAVDASSREWCIVG